MALLDPPIGAMSGENDAKDQAATLPKPKRRQKPRKDAK